MVDANRPAERKVLTDGLGIRGVQADDILDAIEYLSDQLGDANVPDSWIDVVTEAGKREPPEAQQMARKMLRMRDAVRDA